MSDSFNLIDEPWILVRTLEGNVENVSLRAALQRSAQFDRLAGELPTQDFAVLRILLAVLYRALLSQELDDPEEEWLAWWQAESLPMAAIDTYLDTWHDSFNLFDSVHPWFQASGLRTSKDETKPVSLLVPDSPEMSFFAMRRDVDSLTPAESARWLVHSQAYDFSGIKSGAADDPRVKGGKGYPIGPGFAGWLGGITVTGANLRETLLLNLVASFDVSDDLPIWEQPPLTGAPRDSASATGPVSLFTWPQRRIKLFRNDAGNVDRVLIANGDPVDYRFQLKSEPMTGWRFSKPQTAKTGETVYMPRAFSSDAAIWRGLNALLPVTVENQIDDFRPAKVIDWVQTLAQNGYLPKDRLMTISTVSMVYGTQQASWEEIVSDELSFDVRLAASTTSTAKNAALDAVDRTVRGVHALRRFAENVQVAAGRSDAMSDAGERAFAVLDQPFRAWLRNFSPDEDVVKQLQQWTDTARNILLKLAENIAKQASPKAFVGRSVSLGSGEFVMDLGKAQALFQASLYKELPPLHETSVTQMKETH